MHALKLANAVLFLSTLSLRRATYYLPVLFRKTIISIHALLAESDLNSAYGALEGASISIHALLAESDLTLIWDVIAEMTISIHALLAESDPSIQVKHLPKSISIHALLAESDYQDKFSIPPVQKFLSTLSLRRATWIDGLRA